MHSDTNGLLGIRHRLNHISHRELSIYSCSFACGQRSDLQYVVSLIRPKRCARHHECRNIDLPPSITGVYRVIFAVQPAAPVHPIIQIGERIGVQCLLAEDAIDRRNALAQIVGVIVQRVRVAAHAVRVGSDRVGMRRNRMGVSGNGVRVRCNRVGVSRYRVIVGRNRMAMRGNGMGVRRNGVSMGRNRMGVRCDGVIVGRNGMSMC